MHRFVLVALVTLAVGCSETVETVGASLDDGRESVIKESGSRWVLRAQEIERRACSCTGKDCFKRFMDDLKKFKDDAGKQKVNKEDADKIRSATETAMKCALRTHKTAD